MRPQILYEDNHLIVVYKPAGMLVQGDRSGDKNLLDGIKAFLKERDAKPGNVFLGLVHRLDRPASGIVLFSKTSKGAARLSAQFRTREIQKTYHALIHGHLEPSVGALEHRLLKDETSRKAVVSEKGDLARLTYETMATSERYSLVRIELETGRFHQIRAQFAAMGHPIVGDMKYGASEPLPDRSIALCATQLTFMTATGGETKILSVPYPASWDMLLAE